MKKVSLSFAIWLWQQCGAEEGFNYSLLQISSVWWWQFPLFSCQGQAKTFFLPRWWRWWRLFWQQSDICWTNTLLLRQICTFFCQNFESSGWRAARKKSTQTLMNMSSKCRGISKKTQSRNSCKKRETKNDNMQSNYQLETSTIRNQI